MTQSILVVMNCLYAYSHNLHCSIVMWMYEISIIYRLLSKYTHLTAHNWKKSKRVFLTCPCHEIYRDEAVGLKNANYTLKIMICSNMLNLGLFCEKSIFCQ